MVTSSSICNQSQNEEKSERVMKPEGLKGKTKTGANKTKPAATTDKKKQDDKGHVNYLTQFVI